MRNIIILLALALLTSCIKERDFQMEEGLVTDVANLNDLQISYRMPVGFKAVNQSFVDSISQINLYANPFERILTRLYVDTVLSNANVSIYDMRHIPAEKTENELDFYKQNYNAQKYWDKVSKRRYKSNEFPRVEEITMTNSYKTLIRVIYFDDKKAKFCVDYYFPTEFYEDFMPFVQSSIASTQNSYQLIISQE
jgi:hypothetical protein